MSPVRVRLGHVCQSSEKLTQVWCKSFPYRRITFDICIILKELNGLTDDEIIEECEFDFRYQYALHTTSYENQPLSNRTFSRFRERNAAYELTTGKDLIHDCIVALSENIRKFR